MPDTVNSYYDIPELPGNYAGDHPVAASTIIPAGAAVALDASGNAVPAASTVTGQVIGIAENAVDNSAGSAGDLTVRVRRGVFCFGLTASNPPTKAYIGQRVWFDTADTVTIDSTGTCRGGILLGFDSAGLAIVDLTLPKGVAPVTLGNANSEIGGLTIGATYAQAEVTALRDKCEELADDVRALAAAWNKAI